MALISWSVRGPSERDNLAFDTEPPQASKATIALRPYVSAHQLQRQIGRNIPEASTDIT